MTWLSDTPAAHAADVHGRVLQTIILALGDDRRWKGLSASISYLRNPGGLKDPAPLNQYREALTQLHDKVSQLDRRDLAGLAAFDHCSSTALAVSAGSADSDDAQARAVVRCMGWQEAAFERIAGALQDGGHGEVRTLWHAHALDAGGHIANIQALRSWKLLVIGDWVRGSNSSHYVEPTADHYDGVLVHQLRAGKPAATLFSDYPLDNAVLREWLVEKAPALHRGSRLLPADSIDWKAVGVQKWQAGQRDAGT